MSAPRIRPRRQRSFVIVGAGFGGLGAAISLRRLGYDDITIIDRADGVGGTWHWNTYPGLAVDIASTTYSYSFEPNPWWQRVYAKGPELKRYAEHVTEKYDLRRHLRLKTDVESATFDDTSGTWTVRTGDGDDITADVMILATGFLSQPKYPDIPGLDAFGGKTIHTARWDHDHDLRGRRAAVIGTGATAVQLLPEIAPLLDHLDVYQRTPIWCAPKLDTEIPEPVQRLFARIPMAQRGVRAFTSTALEVMMVAGPLHRRELPWLTKSAELMCKAHLRRQVPDPDLRRKLTPAYDFGCKRPTFSNDYYPTFMRENVELVTDPIECITQTGIRTRDGRERPIDTLILATGYKVWEPGNFPAFEVRGRGGRSLREYWETEHFQSYQGITVHGFPNMFYMASPFAFTGLSVFFAIEGQMAHIERCLRLMDRRQAAVFEPTATAQERFMDQMQRNYRSTVFAAGQCGGSNSYYFNQHGESTLLRPQPTPIALRQTARFPSRDYQWLDAHGRPIRRQRAA
ncbi:MAG: NAD(P)/FAD-dependent oxidoreductase [Candidatus Dadabacteria bacterium]|nr:MAG: NAD(P)/FAD-dependent oxidoreductase [Candidatus Dadabacteria bacterium]